ncbi:hypothetical protein POM88_048104 [Heracleum sosnowskyi]|uniref:Uncharacterized protein n=1 Tax=Heracleum sosnowskyi TaxID=360622 RepID=A0AAD8GUQ0_9APIA|nr:hypothetical protein POM88_048104 [Heracleum sosnowskyi]
MWTLWLIRNQRVFNNSKIRLEGVVKLVKVRSQEWALERNIILEEAAIWWDTNPTSVVARSRDLKVERLFVCDCDLICFIDGACKSYDMGIVKSGIRGVIKDRDGHTKLIFSGPCSVENVFDS